MNTKNIRKGLIGLSVVFLSVLSMFVPRARGNEADQATKFTFNEPIELPGNKVLPAGTYWFVVPDSKYENIMQIFDQKRDTVRASIQTVPAERSKPTTDTELVFAAPSGNQPVELLQWFYPTELSGYEFVYDKNEETKVAREPQITVMADPTKSVSGD